MNKPDYLCRFPCMDPWIGPKYGCDGRRLAVVAESHYLPAKVTCLNYDPEKWYAAKQECVPDKKGAHSYMNTRTCVERRHQSDNPTYRKIEAVVSFEEIAFFNYVFRPAEHCRPGYAKREEPCKRFKILDKDRKISSEIMEWFIWMYRPTAIIIASTIVMKWTCVRCDLAAHPEIKQTCITDHPLSTAGPSGNPDPFLTDVRKFLKDPSYPGGRANSPWCLNEDQQACCRSYPWRKKTASS